MRIDLVGWSSEGLRCPDVKIDLRHGDDVADVALIQMPNGTGKTTTLQLLNAALSGVATQWTPDKVRNLRRKGETHTKGSFKVTLLLEQKNFLTLEIVFDFSAGKARYMTTTAGSGGVVAGFMPPATIHRFLGPAFLSLFIFDGEFAARLLDASKAEADQAVDALCQIYLLDDVVSFSDAFWEAETKAPGAKTSSGLKTWRDTRAGLVDREVELVNARKEGMTELASLDQRITTLKDDIDSRTSTDAALTEKLANARTALGEAQARVRSNASALMTAMRLPHALHPALGERLLTLHENFDKLRLPENTSAQFFEDLVDEKECICGRCMDEAAKKEIRTRSKGYLDVAESGSINAMKGEIHRFISTPEEDSGNARVQRLAKALALAMREERAADGQVRALLQQMTDDGSEQVKALKSELAIAEARQIEVRELIEDINAPGDLATDINDTLSLAAVIAHRKDAESKIAKITDTLKLREQTDIVQAILKEATARARAQIKTELIEECNKRLAVILANDPLRIERIDRSIRLEDQDGASVGQILSVGYTFLMSVLRRGNNDFPLIVDSPAGPIDQGVRRRIGRLIPDLCSQFVGFTINTEREGFVPALEKTAKRMRLLTVFRQTEGAQRLMADLPAGKFEKTANAVLVDDPTYFNAFDIEDEEEELHGISPAL